MGADCNAASMRCLLVVSGIGYRALGIDVSGSDIDASIEFG